MSTTPAIYQSEPIVELALAQIHEAEDNTRKSYDAIALDELARSISSSGVIQPLIVRILDTPTGDGEYEIVVGHRRYRACGIAGRVSAPCIVRRMTDAEAHELRILENLQREDIQPLDEAEAYQRMFALAEAAGHPITPADVAAKIAKSESYVRLRLRLLTAEPDVRTALRNNLISLSHVLEIARLDSSLQNNLLQFCLFESWNAKRRRESLPSLAELRKHIAEEVMLVLSDAPFDMTNASLVPTVGACTDCKNRTGNDQNLFPDIDQTDTCTLPSCFKAKVARHIDVTIEALTAKGKSVARLSDDYYRSSKTDKEALTRDKYMLLKKAPKCADQQPGVYVDGSRIGKTVIICANGKCTIHKSQISGSASSVDTKVKRAAARKEATVRGRIFHAIYTASADTTLTDEHTYSLAEYAVKRADHNGLMKLAKLLDWPKDLFSWDNKGGIRKKLEEGGVASAVSIALLASVSSDLSVNEYTSGKAERLEALAKVFSVNTAIVRKDVDSELKAKVKKPTPAKAVSAPKKEKAADPVVKTKTKPKTTAIKKQKPAQNTASEAA